MPDRTRFNDAARGYEHPVRPLADGAQFSREDLDMLRSLEKGREAELRAKQQEQEARKAQDRAHFMKLVSREEAKAAPKLVPKWAADLLNRHQIAAEAERRRQHANKRALKVIERKYAHSIEAIYRKVEVPHQAQKDFARSHDHDRSRTFNRQADRRDRSR